MWEGVNKDDYGGNGRFKENKRLSFDQYINKEIPLDHLCLPHKAKI